MEGRRPPIASRPSPNLSPIWGDMHKHKGPTAVDHEDPSVYKLAQIEELSKFVLPK